MTRRRASDVLVVGVERQGRIPLMSPTDSDVHALLLRGRIPSAEWSHGRTIRTSRLADVWALAQAEGWRVVESKARRAVRA